MAHKWKVIILMALTTNPKFWSTSHSVTWPNFLNKLLMSSLVVPSTNRPTNILVGISYPPHTMLYSTQNTPSTCCKSSWLLLNISKTWLAYHSVIISICVMVISTAYYDCQCISNAVIKNISLSSSENNRFHAKYSFCVYYNLLWS